jgi:serine/threonine protein kinase
MRAHLYDEPKNPREVNPQISSGAVLLLGKLMAKSPEARYQSGTELAEDVERVLAGQPPAFAASAQLKPARRLKRTVEPQPAKKWRFAGCLSAIALAACAALALAALLARWWA